MNAIAAKLERYKNPLARAQAAVRREQGQGLHRCGPTCLSLRKCMRRHAALHFTCPCEHRACAFCNHPRKAAQRNSILHYAACNLSLHAGL